MAAVLSTAIFVLRCARACFPETCLTKVSFKIDLELMRTLGRFCLRSSIFVRSSTYLSFNLVGRGVKFEDKQNGAVREF